VKKALVILVTLALLSALSTVAAAAPRGGYTPADLPERDPILMPTMQFVVDDGPKLFSGNKYAVVIGISDYYGSSSDLRYCDDDAWDVYYALTGEYGFPSGNIYMLLDSQATYANILGAVDWLKNSAGSGDIAVFTYSGHGSYGTGDPDGDGESTDECIIPWELSRLWDGTLASYMSGISASKVWISFDSCFAGGMVDYGISKSGRIVSMACRSNEYAGESSSVRNGFYTYLMIDRGMRRGYADLNGDGYISVEEAFTYCSNNMGYYSYSQHPQINDQYSGSMYLY